MLEPFDLGRFLAGTALYLLPGFVWSWALAPGLGVLQKVPLAVVVAFTLPPGTLFLLHLVLSVPIHLGTHTFLAATLSVLGGALLVRRLTKRAWSGDGNATG